MEEIMTIEEASEKYCIPIKILKEYESMELCKTVKRVMGEWHYNCLLYTSDAADE